MKPALIFKYDPGWTPMASSCFLSQVLYQSGMLHLLDWADVAPIHVHRTLAQTSLEIYINKMDNFIMCEFL